MQCLQCGKSVPLLKRLAGSEFCSDAHRREYQKEFSQLALGRLLQSKPAERETQPAKAPLLATVPAPPPVAIPAGVAVAAPAAAAPAAPASAREKQPATAPVNGTKSAIAMPAAVLVRGQVTRVATTQPVVTAAPNGIAKPQPPPPPPNPVKKVATEPAVAKPAVIHKPAPAGLQFTVVITPEFEHVFSSLVPDRPRREPHLPTAELAQGRAVQWGRRVEIADSPGHPVERKLELREAATPRIALDLRIPSRESLETEDQSLMIPMVSAFVPAEASLWISPYRDFAGLVLSLNDFADAQFSAADFEAPPLAGGSAGPSDSEPLPMEPQVSAVESEPPQEAVAASGLEAQITAAPHAASVPDPALHPLPVSYQGTAPGKAKPIQVSGPALFNNAGAVQIPQPSGLPLRPVMVLAPAAVASIKPSLQAAKTSTLFSTEPNLGLPQLRMQTPSDAGASRTRKLIAAVAGASVLAIGIVFFLGSQSDARSKAPAVVPALADQALGSQWIANFAPDPARQRKVSILRSSVTLPDYRLDFEGSIQIKALGWVYRAQDAKNFYVSKIELQKPGQNPTFVMVHYAVINGVDQPRVEVPLRAAVPLGGLYKIRLYAVGDRFAAWVQDQPVDQWTDPRLKSGGAGLYSEGVEQSTLHGDFKVTPLSNQQ